MKVIRATSELGDIRRGFCLAIGVFDGVHLGHQQIIRQTVADARRHDALSLVVTFDRHPNAVVAPDRVPPAIYSQAQKLRVIESLGADALLLIHFDKAFSEQTGEVFVRGLEDGLRPGGARLSEPQHVQESKGATGHRPALHSGIRSICVGADFTFGHKRSGNVDLLKRLGAELGFAVHGMAAVSLDGDAVSSTRIRDCIRAGEFDLAGQMLGRTYSLAGRVAAGEKLGRQLGFPTTNLEVAGLALPPGGVYAVHAAVRGNTYRAVLNIGHRPTLGTPDPQWHVEAHLLDFTGDLYDEEMEITFVARLRDEQKFPSLTELKEQIGRDIAEAKRRY